MPGLGDLGKILIFLGLGIVLVNAATLYILDFFYFILIL